MQRLFFLKKLKFKNERPQLSYQTKTISDDITTTRNVDGDVSDLPPHSDLLDQFEQLAEIAQRILGLRISPDTIKKIEMSQPAQKKVLKLNDEFLDRIKPIGLSISGEVDSRIVVITILYRGPKNKTSTINTPPVLLTGTEYGIEEALDSLVDNIQQECHEYVYNLKSTQSQLV